MKKRFGASNIYDWSSFKPHLNLYILFHLIGHGNLASSVYFFLEAFTFSILLGFLNIEWKMSFAFHHCLLPSFVQNKHLQSQFNNSMIICHLFFLIYLFLTEEWLLYNIVLVSAIHQHELATGLHMSPPSWTSLVIFFLINIAYVLNTCQDLYLMPFRNGL